jgi:hypothetical protein
MYYPNSTPTKFWRIGGRTFNGVKLGARAGGSDPTGRIEALRPSAAGCQPTSESIMDARSASKDGRSRRSAPGYSPQKPSDRSPDFFRRPRTYLG